MIDTIKRKRRKTLKEIEQEMGEPLDVMIPRMLRENGGSAARVAFLLGVYPNSIRNWLVRNHMQVVVQVDVVPVEEQPEVVA